MLKLNELAEEFADLDDEERLQLLMEFAESLPAPTGDHGEVAGDESCRVQECQTPVYLWVGLAEGRVVLEADVPRKSPTVRGLVAVIVEGLTGAEPQEVFDLPDDLLPLLGLQQVLGMTRQQGVRGMTARIKRELRRAVEESAA